MNNEQSAAKLLNEYLINEYSLEKISLRGLEQKSGVSRYKLRKYLLTENIQIKKDYKFKMYSLKSNTFGKINTSDKAYWLGFLFADGSMNKGDSNYKIELTLKESDGYHVQRFKNFLKSDHPVKKIPNGNTDKYAYKIMIGCKEMYTDLEKLGCTQCKSHNIKFPFGKMPTDLLRHFVRGFFDGDGGVHKRKDRESLIVTFTSGNKDFLEAIFKLLPTTRNNSNITKARHAECYELRYSSKVDVKMIYDYLYTDVTTYLNRKKQIFNSVSWIEKETKLEEGSETIILQSFD